MSSNEDKDLKAGHPPAEKAGGMRIVQKKKPEDKGSTMTPEEEEEYGSSPKTESQHDQKVVVSGAVTKEERAFPPEAVKVYHDKPQPAQEKRPAPHQQQHHINQPRKQ